MVPYIIEKVEKLYLCGDTAEKIEKAVTDSGEYKGSPQIIRTKDIAEAVEKAYNDTKSGDIVTLSPACASFDCFPNFAARGNYFKELVNKL
jgi:UDP-N-acetylmuramoylalanine--D-glutamate ligase